MGKIKALWSRGKMVRPLPRLGFEMERRTDSDRSPAIFPDFEETMGAHAPPQWRPSRQLIAAAGYRSYCAPLEYGWKWRPTLGTLIRG